MRLVEDRLRAEYVSLLPKLQRTLIALETELNFLLLPLKLRLDQHERILVRGRVKESESAVDSLRRRQEGGTFDSDHPEKYSLTMLPDLVGARILTFPHSCFDSAQRALAPKLSEWTADHIPSENAAEPPLALKFHGRWNSDDSFDSEIQVAPLLIGLFWEVEHSAIYKPGPNLRGVGESMAMKRRTLAVLASLRQFEDEFSRQIANNFELLE